MVVSCCVVGCSDRAKKSCKKSFYRIPKVMNKLRQFLRRGNNFSGVMNQVCLTSSYIHNGSQGMTNGCPGLIKKIGIHQNTTVCALITF